MTSGAQVGRARERAAGNRKCAQKRTRPGTRGVLRGICGPTGEGALGSSASWKGKGSGKRKRVTEAGRSAGRIMNRQGCGENRNHEMTRRAEDAWSHEVASQRARVQGRTEGGKPRSARPQRISYIAPSGTTFFGPPVLAKREMLIWRAKAARQTPMNRPPGRGSRRSRTARAWRSMRNRLTPHATPSWLPG